MKTTSSFAILALASAAASAQLSRPVITTLPGGVVRVANSGPSRWEGTSGWRLELERTITPEEGSPGMLAMPSRLVVSRTGRILVYDFKATGLLLFESDGRFVRRIGGKGAGPGEFHFAGAIDFRGDTIALVDDDRAVVWRDDGTLIGQWTTNASSGSTRLDGKGRLLVPVVLPAAWPGRPAFIRYDFKGSALDTLLHAPPQELLAWRVAGGGLAAIPFRPVRVGAFDSRLQYIHGFSDKYTIAIGPTGRDTSRIIMMPGARARVSERFRDSIFQAIVAKPLFRNVAKASDIPTEHPFFYDFHVDELDNIWVDRPGPEGKTVSFDVIDSGGRFLGSAAAPAGLQRAAVWANGRMYQFAENDDGVPVIQVFKVNRDRPR